MSNPTEDRIEKAVQAAQARFWEAVAEAFPEATTGDLAPVTVARFDRECNAAVTLWVRNNTELVVRPPRGDIEIISQPLIICMSGGLIDAVHTDAEITDVFVLDEDTEGADIESLYAGKYVSTPDLYGMSALVLHERAALEQFSEGASDATVDRYERVEGPGGHPAVRDRHDDAEHGDATIYDTAGEADTDCEKQNADWREEVGLA